MSNLPLPGLTPGDPENRLSHEARQRISAALREYDRMRKQTRSAIELRGDWDTPQAHIEMRQTDMEATRVVLRAEAEEYGKLALPAVEFREIMQARIEAMVYSMEFSTLQRDALEAEFLWSSQRERPAPVAPAAVSPADEKPAEVKRTAGDRVKAFIAEQDLDDKRFAAKIHRSVRQVAKVKADRPVGMKTQALVAKVLGTTPEELFRK